MLRFSVPDKARKLKGVITGTGSGPLERIQYLQILVTKLFRHERIEGREDKMLETRQYAEQLINIAMAHGDKHEDTMNMASQWLWEKDLIHKLFKVYVPRYINYDEAFTNVYTLPATYPGTGRFNAVLELKGNPYPPVLPQQRKTDGLISNVLIQSCKRREEMAKLLKLDPTRVAPENGSKSPDWVYKSTKNGSQTKKSAKSAKVEKQTKAEDVSRANESATSAEDLSQTIEASMSAEDVSQTKEASTLAKDVIETEDTSMPVKDVSQSKEASSTTKETNAT